jgi:hypothetical protein
MRFDVTTPCAGCPFRRRGKLAVRLGRSRIMEVAGNMLDINGGTFTCHKKITGQTDSCNQNYRPSVDDVHCAGALIFAERNNNQTRMMQIAERIGLYQPDLFCSAKQRRLVFATIDEMLKTALPPRR